MDRGEARIMTEADFWASDEPFVVVMGDRSQMPLSVVFSHTGRIAVARLDGSILENDDNVFLAFYNAFDFPEYFGWNWDALSDCLRDLAWFSADRYLVLIDRADQVLAEDKEGRRVLFSILKRVASNWANPMTSGHAEPIPFKIVLLCDEGHVEGLRDEVRVS
jgi:RNAse (barnase) inhibitor barstar